MFVVAIEFTAHRYHATPWGAHVNEGRVEWPPGPWRLLRAWIAVGYNKQGWDSRPPGNAESLINKLAACYPDYVLPHGSEAHTRHYMPSREGRQEKKSKVFDSFIRCNSANDRMLIRYNVALGENEISLWQQLVAGMSYLGRAESWVDAELLVNPAIADYGPLDWYGLADDSVQRRVRLLAPVPAKDYEIWRNAEITAAREMALGKAEAAAAASGKRSTATARARALAKAEAPFPKSLLDSLQQDNASWQRNGWPRPPASQWVDYALPDKLFEHQPLSSVAVNPEFLRPEAILLSIDGEGEQRTMRPRMQSALPLMELLHAEAIRHACRLNLKSVPELTGTNPNGTPLKTGHTHAHWLPLSLVSQGFIDHVLVYAPGGFSSDALQAVSSISRAYAKGISALSITMVGRGTIADIASQLARSGCDVASFSALSSGLVWESVTPFVLRKYLDRKKQTIYNQINEELVERGFPESASIEVWTPQEQVRRKLKGYILRRKPSKRQPPVERSWGVRIKFATQIEHRPLSLGYASHFGLGLFRVVC